MLSGRLFFSNGIVRFIPEKHQSTAGSFFFFGPEIALDGRIAKTSKRLVLFSVVADQ